MGRAYVAQVVENQILFFNIVRFAAFSHARYVFAAKFIGLFE